MQAKSIPGTLATIALCALFCNVHADTSPPPLFPFVIPRDFSSTADAPTRSVADASHLNDHPAGSRGHITADARGRLHTAGHPGDPTTRRRIRFLGVNLSFGANFPARADAEILAARLARLGINCVRFHHMDREAAPRGILAPDLRTLDPGQLAKLDYLIARLTARGIYADLNLHVSRSYPDYPDANTPGVPRMHKGIDHFTDGMIEWQRAYARELLTHRNPHTGLTYAEDPAIAFVEINNENGLISRWWDGALDDLPPPLADDLRQRWNTWIHTHTGPPGKALAAWQTARTPPGPELLRNPTFSENRRHWTLETSPDSTRPRPAQIHQRGLRLQPGQPCTLRLTLNATDTPAAPAPPTQTITLGIKDARPPWRIHFSTPVTLSATKTTVTEASFLYEAEPDAELRFNLQDLPANATGITLQSASLRQGGTAGSPPPRLASAPHTFDYPRKRTFKTLSIPAQRDWLRFLWQTEERYWLAMRDYLRHDLGVRSLLIGTQLGAYSIFPIQQQLDALDIHAYWQHPEFHGDRNDRNNWTVGNKSMVSDPSGAYASYPSLYRVAGKPYLLTEYNHPSPNTYGAEAFPIISAYAAFQDWDAIFAYSWAHGVISWDAGYQTGNFDIDQNPVKLVTLPLAAALFRRGDVDTPGPAHLKTIPVAPDAALDSLRRSGTRLAADLFGGSRHEALRIPYAVRLARPGEAGAHPAPTRAPAYAWTGPITTRGGALTWDAAPDAGLFTIRTPRTKAAIGFTRSRAHDLGGLVIRPAPNRQDWATIALTQTLGPRIGAPGRALLIACGDMENTGQIWKNASKNNVTDWGHAPTLVEGIPADITLALVAPATTLTVWALDARGQRATPVPATITGNTAHFSIGPAYKTLWYEIHTR